MLLEKEKARGELQLLVYKKLQSSTLGLSRNLSNSLRRTECDERLSFTLYKKKIVLQVFSCGLSFLQIPAVSEKMATGTKGSVWTQKR